MLKALKRITGFSAAEESTENNFEYEKEAVEEDLEGAIENNSGEEWLEEENEEGQLSIDVYQTADKIVVKSTIAGVKPEDIDISINNDMLTIRGKREMQEAVNNENYLFKECYWGSFSRSVILPTEINSDKIDASLDNGVLTVILPKAKISKSISIKVKEK